mmetsp:Transcript_26864/g.47801  ORF Transcript_26864/g.47801 Transcript_26864/m.47801 type:complete len:232 (-) Transcript_26864:1018-1713(-)
MISNTSTWPPTVRRWSPFLRPLGCLTCPLAASSSETGIDTEALRLNFFCRKLPRFSSASLRRSSSDLVSQSTPITWMGSCRRFRERMLARQYGTSALFGKPEDSRYTASASEGSRAQPIASRMSVPRAPPGRRESRKSSASRSFCATGGTSLSSQAVALPCPLKATMLNLLFATIKEYSIRFRAAFTISRFSPRAPAVSMTMMGRNPSTCPNCPSSASSIRPLTSSSALYL